MSIPGLLKTPARFHRLGQIVGILAKHGFGYLAHYLNLQGFLRPADRIRESPELAPRRREDGISVPRRVVLVLEELGPTFVKLGQLLSTRPDIVPEEYLTELSKLQDHVKPFDSETARRAVEQELGAPLSSLFSYFSREPFAAGSIAQVYHATLATGEDVVVKVKRPGIERIIFRDLDLLALVAERAERVEELKPFRPVTIVEEFSRSLRREMDFVTEASFTSKFHDMFRHHPYVRAPRVFWEYTTSSVLTLEEIKGIPISRHEELERMGIDRKLLARRLVDLFLRQYFRTGLFHADPHPGNLLVDEKGTIGIVDFGMVGHLDAELKSQLATTLIALTRRNVEVIVEIYSQLGVVSEDADLRLLRADALELLDKYYGIPIKRIDLQNLFSDVMRLARVHRVVLPRDFVLLGKSLVTVGGLARGLDPEFDIASVAKPHALGLIAEKLSPTRAARELAMSLWHVHQMLRRMPRDVGELSRKLLGGRLRLMLTIREFEGLMPELNRATNRLAFAIIVGAVVIGSSFVIHAKIRPHLDWVPIIGKYLGEWMPEVSVLGLLGYLFAGILGLALAWGIWRHGKL